MRRFYWICINNPRKQVYKNSHIGNTPEKGVDDEMEEKKKIRRNDIPYLEEKERRKYEVAEELGLLDKVLEEGWRSLSSKETGRIGGIISKKNK